MSELLDCGADLALVSKLAGHANVQTTAIYDKRPERQKAKAAGMLQVPFVEPNPAIRLLPRHPGQVQ